MTCAHGWRRDPARSRPAMARRGRLSCAGRMAAVLAVALTLAGCEFFRSPPPAPAAAPDPAELALVEAALRAEAALASLARAQAAGNPVGAQPPPALVPDELKEPVTLDWIGPLEGLAARLAERAGWAFVEAGPSPVVPLIVEVSVEALPTVLVLRDAGVQAGSAALLTVDAARREVRLDWAGEGDDV